MTIQWLTGGTFLIQTKGIGRDIQLMTDPPRSAKIPKTEAHILLLSEFQQNSPKLFPFLKATEKPLLVIDTPGEYEREGVSIYGIAETDSNPPRTFYVCESEGMSFLFIGSAFAQGLFTNDQVETIGDIDLILLPLGTRTLGGAKAAHLVHQLEPRLVIGSCIGNTRQGLLYDDEKEFVKKSGLPATTEPKLKIAKKDLPQEETKLILLEPQ